MMFIAIITMALAKETWFCTEAASKRTGSALYVCGIGEDKLEANARKNALENAYSEFSKLCEMDDYCSLHKATITPMRTSCEKENNSYKCYRMVVFIMNEEKIGPFLLKRTNKVALLKAGMTKKEVATSLGIPQDTSLNAWIYYKQKFCTNSFQEACSVIFNSENKVISWDKIKPEFTDLFN